MHAKPRILFVLKYRPNGPYGSWSYSEGTGALASGLSISVQQMVTALTQMGIDAHAVQVPDNNFIHQEVEKWKPTHVVVEGFWVVPPKFQILKAMHPKIHWVVRCHSNTEFLAHEGTVFGWVLDYLSRGVTVGFNSMSAAHTIRRLVDSGLIKNPGPIVFLPNYYDFNRHFNLSSIARTFLESVFNRRRGRPKVSGEFHVGCFGAVRPLKNHMNQALAAIQMANRLGLKLRFYVNASRVENQGEALVRSLKSLFDRAAPHELIQMPWMQHTEFLNQMVRMDMVTQVSMSETFNIVLADAVSCGIPVVGSNIPWLPRDFQADPLDVEGIVERMYTTWLQSGNLVAQQRQQRGLSDYVLRSKYHWERWLFD